MNKKNKFRDKYLNLFLLISFICSFLMSCVSAPLPKDALVTIPSSKLSPKIAAFSGIWQGNWVGAFEGKLVVERIDEKTADIIISWGAFGKLERGFLRATVNVYSDSTLIFEDDINKWTFKMNDDLTTVSGEVFEKAVKSRMDITMQKMQ